jgi:hypothetical protein
MKFHTVLIIKTYQNYNWELDFKVAHKKMTRLCKYSRKEVNVYAGSQITKQNSQIQRTEINAVIPLHTVTNGTR